MIDGWWVARTLENGGPPELISWIVVVVGSIVLHELAHGWAAVRLGDETPIHAGHMTWNPLVHLGGYSLVCFALFGIAWGAMPVDASRVRGRYGMTMVLLAGPAMNLAIALAAMLAGGAWSALAGGVGSPLYENAQRFFDLAALLNVVLALLNMVPVFPLDGGRIAGELFPAYERFATSEHGQWAMLGLFLLVFWFGGPVLFLAGAIAAGVGIGLSEALFSLF